MTGEGGRVARPAPISVAVRALADADTKLAADADVKARSNSAAIALVDLNALVMTTASELLALIAPARAAASRRPLNAPMKDFAALAPLVAVSLTSNRSRRPGVTARATLARTMVVCAPSVAGAMTGVFFVVLYPHSGEDWLLRSST